MNPLPALPLIIPLTTAAVTMLLGRTPRARQAVSVLGAALLLAAALALLVRVEREGIQVVQVGRWPYPVAISLMADLFSAGLVVLAGLLGLAVSLYSMAGMDAARKAFNSDAFMHVLLMGVCGAFLTGDLFNLYVWFEVLLIASFALLALGGERPQIEGAVKYVTLNLIASALFLAAVGLLYGLTGTLSLADLAQKLPQTPRPGTVAAVAVLLLAAFGIKAAFFPLFFWLPASYPTPPMAVTALFAGLLTKVGLYALIRVFCLLFAHDFAFFQPVLVATACLTMVTGVLGAASQYDFRRILAFHSISQVGYMLLGLALFARQGLAGALFFIFHHGLVKSSLFLVSGLTHRLRGTYDLKALGGLQDSSPGVALLFALFALSLAGLPPSSGFFAKLALVREALAQGRYVSVAVALTVSVLTLFSMTKIWAEAFWKPPPVPATGSAPPLPRSMVLPVGALALGVLWLGLVPGPAFGLLTRAAEQLLSPDGYILAARRAGR
ncbi:proton-conducting transporter membrane subunit [Corallococcus sp. 4LFB]|uniref:proton-conducting transporter transmembrane domain-containing protein n=1 Tax=Corallococcus sp. 4LFB TaxID=3383249 RepID=UPI0039755E6C